MMILILIILIVLLIDKHSEYKKLLEENKKLKEKLKSESTEKLENINEQVPLIQSNDVSKVSEQYFEEQLELSQHFNADTKVSTANKTRNEKEQKNISILVTGAICIVLSAIVFLMSTWNSIPNILKTIVLSLLTLVFFGGSYIAKEKFKLDKTSQTFFYIAMAYIPICLLSISIFELFGTYLSIFGEGKYIYLMLSSIFVALIYYSTYMKKNNKYLLYGSLLSQVFSIITFSLIFSNNILAVGINLLLYNILLMLLTKKDVFIKVYNFILVIITLLAIPLLFEQSITMVFMLLLLAINFLILELKNSLKIYSYMFNIFMTVFGIYTIFTFDDILVRDTTHFLILCFTLLLYIIENMLLINANQRNLQKSLTVVTISTLALLHIESFIHPSLMTPYIISIVQLIILIITYIKFKSLKKNIIATLIPLYFIVTGINIISELECSYYFYILFAFLTFIASEFLRKKDKFLYLHAFIISHILVSSTYVIAFITNFSSFINNMLYPVLLTGVYIYSYFANKNVIFKYLGYFTSNFVLFTLFSFFISETTILYYVPMVSTLIIMGIELICKNLQDDASDIYLAISKIISFSFIYSSTLYKSNEIATILAIIFAILIIVDNIKHKNQLWNILPLTCILPALFLNSLSTELKLGIMLMTVIATTGISLKEKKLSIFTIFSGIYLFFTSLNIESIYLKEILFISWSIVHFLFITPKKEKDIFKFLSYLSILLLYNDIILDLQLGTYTLFFMLGYIVIAILTLRTIMIKYITKVDAWEYITFGLIYLIALLNYSNESDGMLFGILIVIIIITSYLKKYGALFMVSLFAILVNIFALTREFWFSVPWWIYLLTIGTILIGFAIKNEITDKKTEINAINLLKNIKERIEK